ncbi:hypothetical protein BDV33DRAFT_196274 [Aspergillus novoparasiticus]|uniref:Aminoglycoside phosphotransferase domain-containing protein n=1 Tax=Aspergillus novoparasiticus TaxID=986946 RepID=A0A5N6EBP3_9EURO|nr:hypothetical protein BDV33DRAFT_196274 [Aspergillus novoparasiticus]
MDIDSKQHEHHSTSTATRSMDISEGVVTVIHKLCARVVLEYDFSFVTKSGFGVRPAEAEAMRLISKYTSVPAPKVYHTNFSSEYKESIEMSLIQGSSLEKTWDTMDEKTKESIYQLLEDLRARIYERYLHFGGRRYEYELPDMLPRSDRAGNITGIIDWEYAGWYLDYWEYVQILRPAFWGDWSIWMERTAPERWDLTGVNASRKVLF